MSVDQVTAGGVFRIGEVLSRAWRIFIGNILFFLGVPVLVCAAMVGAFAASIRLVGMAGDNQKLACVGLAAVVILGLYVVGQAMVLIGGFQRLSGEPLRVDAALRGSLVRALPLVALSVLWSLAIAIFLVLAYILPAGLWANGGGTLLYYAAAPMPLVPVAILFVLWAVVVPACVVEGLGPVASMIRSTDLTKGHRWKVFGIELLVALLTLGRNLIDLMLAPSSPMSASLVGAAWLVAVMAFWNCTLVTMYHDLRGAKGGIDTSQVAVVFD